MKRIDRDTYQLSTGRRLSANRGIFGLEPDKGDPWDSRLSEGYDGHISQGADAEDDPDDKEWHRKHPEMKRPTAEERQELALFQIALWSEWAGLPQRVGEAEEC